MAENEVPKEDIIKREEVAPLTGAITGNTTPIGQQEIQRFSIPEEKYQPVGIGLKRTSIKTKKDFILGGSLFASLPSVSLGNTVTETILGRYPFEKFAFYKDMLLRLCASGSFTTVDAADVVQIAVGLFPSRQTIGSAVSGTPVAAAGILSTAGVVTSKGWWAEAWTGILDVGTIDGFADTSIHGSFNGNMKESSASGAYNDGTVHDLCIYAFWNQATVGTTISLTQMFIEQLR